MVKVEVYVVNRIGLSTETHQRFDRNSLKKKAVWQLLLLFSDERKMALKNESLSWKKEKWVGM